MKFLLEMNELSEEVRLEIIRTSSNEELLEHYSKSPNSKERAAAARNPLTPTKELDDLVFDKNREVLVELVLNPSLLEVSLDRLGDITEDEEILVGIARHKNTSKERLELLHKNAKGSKIKVIVEVRLTTMKAA